MIDNEFHTCDDSRICDELKGRRDEIPYFEVYGHDQPSRVIAESPRFALIADISPLTPGHTLLVPKDHFISFGSIPTNAWDELEAFRDNCVRLIEKHYGIPTILEHGSSSSMRSSPCVSHAHWHLVPGCQEAYKIFESDGLTGEDIESWKNLSTLAEADSAYIYYHFGSLHRAYSENLSKRHQYMRIVIAELLGIAEPEWDWAFLKPANLRATISDLIEKKEAA